MTSITYRTAGAWGAGKGSNLTPGEVDENFHQLALALLAEGTDELPPVGIANITVTGSQMTIVLDDARTFGPFTLPVATFAFRGNWQGGSSYGTYDVVRVAGQGLYMFLQPHTTATDFDPTEETTAGAVYRHLLGSTDNLGHTATVAASSYTLLAADIDGGTILFSNASGCHVLVPTESTDFAIDIGQYVDLVQAAVDHVEVDVEGGVTLHQPVSADPVTAEQWATMRLKKIGTEEWLLSGDLGTFATGET